MGQPLVHWEIASSNAERLRKFYVELFDWTLDDDNPMAYGLLKTGVDGGINGGIIQTKPGMPPYLTFYVHVDDLQSYLDKAERLGGKVIVSQSLVPNVGSFAMFSDPDGNLVGLFKEWGDTLARG